jgi:(p)ppGpp synthase/HD superfamily hydrolase
MKVIDLALTVATRYHEGQRRKNPVAGVQLPYVVHPIEVMKRVWRWGCGSEDIMVAALLHDVIEDCNATANELLLHFSRGSVTLVQELTFDGEVDKDQYLESFATRKKSPAALLLKTADRICNSLDFAGTKCDDYGLRYFNKAAVLGRALKTRFHELEATFSFATADAALADWSDTEWRLRRS